MGLEGESYAAAVLGLFLGRVQRKTYPEFEQQWFLWGVQVGRDLDIRLLRDERFVMPNMADDLQDWEQLSPEDESFTA